MRVTVKLMGEGPGPSERVVSLQTKDGNTEEVVLSTHDLDGQSIEVGAPLDFKDKHYLVELPREAFSGKWRVWVPASETNNHLQAAE